MNLPDNVLKSLGVTTLATVDSRAISDPSQRGRLVPNEQPRVPCTQYKVAVIGEAPGEDEDKEGRPFCGKSGRFLDSLLTAEGLSRPTVFVGNICNFRPPNNELKTFAWQGEEIQQSLQRLESDLNAFNPNICVLLGRYAIYAATGEWRNIGEWRGSVFVGTQGPFKGRKCIATYHPAAALRVYEWVPFIRFDLRRARQQGTSPDFTPVVRQFRTGLSVSQIVDSIEAIVVQYDNAERDARPLPTVWVSFDLEGYWDRVTRFSISTSPTEGFIVPITAGEFGDHWSLAEECRIWRAVARLLEDSRIPKVLQNSLYDRFVLAYLYKLLISNVSYDTMLGHWELYCELPNNLGFQASIYTNEPYWKEERLDEDITVRELYCCKDSAVTEEIRQVQTPLLLSDTRIWNHFQFNVRLLNPILFMELRGLKYDSAAAAKARAEKQKEFFAKQHDLNLLSGRHFVGTRASLLALCLEKLVKIKERQYCISFLQLPALSYKALIPAATRIAEMDSEGLLSDSNLATNTSVLGELEYLLEIHLNTRSNDQMLQYLYIERRYERQYKRDSKTKQQKLSADVMALLNIYRKQPDDAIPKNILAIRSLLYQVQVLGISADPDGRVRCGYNIVAAETARTACYESPTGSGYNLQTVTKKLRYLFRADDGHWLGQCDLSGADGWTVAAHCKSLGDSTMLDDYLAGLKPARIIALMYMELEREIAGYRATNNAEPPALWYAQAVANISIYFNNLSRADLKKLCKQVPSSGWLYFACKRIQHGSNYGAQPPTVSDIILKDSHKLFGEPTYVAPKICALLQRLYLNRYPGIARWHSRVGATVLQYERLVSAAGRVRRFFGRLRDGRELNHETFKAALSNEPQDNTTYATNLAAYNLWYDPDNRDSSRRSGLIVEPLHPVHDALLMQWPKEVTFWALGKINTWFSNELVIAGLKINIPFEGGYGPSWGETDEDNCVGRI